MPSPLDVLPDYAVFSAMQMWCWDTVDKIWYPVNVQDSIEKSMRAYVLFWEKTAWRLIQLRHARQEKWDASLYRCERAESPSILKTGEGSTAAIAICEAIKAASLADTESSKTTETEVRS